jgi:hypothetical protein
MKTQGIGRRVLLAVSGLALLGALGADRVGAQIYRGKATRVGDEPAAGTNGDSVVGLSARFDDGGVLDLGANQLTISAILNEKAALPTPTPSPSPAPTTTPAHTPTPTPTPIPGIDDLVRGFGGAPVLSVTLPARAGSSADSAVYVSPGTIRPSFRAAARRLADGRVQISIKVNRASIPNGPELCSGDPSTTNFATTISFGDGVHAPVFSKTFIQPWLCQSSVVRAVGPPAPTPIPGVPTAILRTNQITRVTGQDNTVRLDGSGSSDSDGTIVEYTFSVVDKETSAAVVPATSIAASSLDVTLPPGDYVASLTVEDNDAKVSKPATRGFTLH